MFCQWRDPMVILLGKYEFRLKKVKAVPVKEEFGMFGKVAESQTFIEFGREESFHFYSWFLIFGTVTATVRRWEIAKRPEWAKVPSVPPPPRPSPEDPNVIQFKGKKT